MTKLPHENWDVKGVTGPNYKVGPVCSAPGCKKFADHAHHIWRRSFLAGDFKWVELWDGRTVPNLVGLCYEHHQDVTENRAMIQFDDTGLFMWSQQTTGDLYAPVGMLNPQPQHSIEKMDDDEEPCPTCGHRTRRRELPPGERRPRKTWTVRVPADSEDGAEVLDELEEQVARSFGIEHYSNIRNRRYFTIVQAFVVVMQNQHLLSRDE